MKIEIRKYQPELKETWDDLVATSINGTFLHTRSFFEHNPLNEKEDCSFMFYKKKKLVGVIPCIAFAKEGVSVLHSYLRSTYGGFIINNDVGTEEALEMVELLISEARKLGIEEVIVSNPFRIFHKLLCDETDFAMWHHGFQVKARELEIAVSLEGAIAEIRNSYDNGTKYNVKKAIKSVTCKISEDYESFWKILEKNLAEKHNNNPVHSIEQIHLLRNLVGDNRIKLFAGYIDGKMVCGVVVFVFDKDLHAQYIGADNDYQETRPMNAVIDFIIEWGNQERFEYFNLGKCTSDNGKSVNLGLFHFKEGFGGRGTLRETMSLTL